MNRTTLAGLTSVAMLLMAGCGGKIKYPSLYTLDIPPAPVQNRGEPRRATLAVRRFTIPSYLREGRIAYRNAPETIGFYDYHRWAANPSESVTTAMIDSLGSARLFSFVTRYDGRIQQDYLMSGRLDKLEELDYGGAVRVNAGVSVELVNLHAGTVVWTGHAEETRAVEARNVNSVVLAMDQALRKDIDRLVASLDERLSHGEGPDEHAKP